MDSFDRDFDAHEQYTAIVCRSKKGYRILALSSSTNNPFEKPFFQQDK